MSLIASPSTIVSTAHLIISATALLTTVPTLLPLSLPPRSTTILRILQTLTLLTPLGLSLYTFATLLKHPTSTITPQNPIFQILFITTNSTTGLTPQVLTPNRTDPQPAAVVHTFIAVLSLLSSVIIIFSRQKIRSETSLLAFATATVYILATLLTTFHPGELPLDTSLLQNKWLDARYTKLRAINETRLLENFWVRDDALDSAAVVGFRSRFCQVFNGLPVEKGVAVGINDEELVPSDAPVLGEGDQERPEPETDEGAEGLQGDQAETPEPDESTGGLQGDQSTADEEDRPQPLARQQTPIPSPLIPPLLTRQHLSEILVAYTIGKPLSTTIGKSLSLLSLPFLTLTPVFLAHAIRSRVLFPFVVAWIGMLLVLTIYATPETLRWIRAPFRPSDDISFCGRSYRVFVTDRVTNRIAVFDVVSFALVGLTAILQGFRWLRRQNDHDEDVKMVSYSDVYTRNGTLRW